MRRTIHKKTGSSYDNNNSCDLRHKDSQEDSGSNSDANISDLGSSKMQVLLPLHKVCTLH